MDARSGFSLVEVTAAMGIMAVLLAIAMPRFQDLLYHYRSESQTRMIYGELLQARARALYQRRETRLRFRADRFEIYSSAADGAAVAPIAVQLLSYPITVSGIGSDVDFDARGLAINKRSICIANPQSGGGLDSVVIADTRVSLGKRDLGNDCDSASITKN